MYIAQFCHGLSQINNGVMLQMKSLENVIDKNWQELQDLLPLITCLSGTKADKEQSWAEVFRFMDQVMPTDTADCSLYLLAEDAFNAITYTDQVCPVLSLLTYTQHLTLQ